MGARRCFFFFQAEDGIRDVAVTGVQTCALPISGPRTAARVEEILQPIVGGQVRADIAAAHLIAGDAQLAAGAKEKARSHWRAAWIEHPLSPAADTARDRERQLGPGGHIAQILLVRRGGGRLASPPHPRAGGPPPRPLCPPPPPPGGAPAPRAGRALCTSPA